MTDEMLMRFPVASDPLGKEQLRSDGYIGLQRIEFNRTKWNAPDPLNAIALTEDSEIVIRRTGVVIEVFRRLLQSHAHKRPE